MGTVLRSAVAAVALGTALAAQTWTQLAPVASPPPRIRHAMAYHQSRDRIVIFGGSNGSTIMLGDSWEFDGSTWHPILVPPALAARIDPGMAYDHRRGKIVLYGGAGVGLLSDTWEYDGTWRQVTTVNNPGVRVGAAMTWDAARGRVVLFSGQALGQSTPSDTWEYDGFVWRQVSTQGTPPGRRFGAMAYDASIGRCVLFGGDDVVNAPLADTWEYDGWTWRQAATSSAPPGRHQHALAYDVVRGRIVLFGGAVWLLQQLSDAWQYDGVTQSWSQLSTQGTAPSARLLPGLAYDVARRRMILFGGWSASNWTHFADTWDLTAAAVPTWTRHGRGCAGSGGVPTLRPRPGAVPALGSQWPLLVGSLPASPGLCLLAFGFDVQHGLGAPLPLDLASRGLPGCRLWIAPDLQFLLPHGGGTASFPLAFPMNPALAGTLVALQALSLDAAAPNGVGAVSNGGILLLR